MKRKPIEQEVIVGAGAASGIGRETALQPASRSARLVVADFGEAGLRSLTMRHSLTTWLDLHPAIRAASVVGAGLAADAVLAPRIGA